MIFNRCRIWMVCVVAVGWLVTPMWVFGDVGGHALGERIVLDASMLTNETGFGEPEKLIDEQAFTGPYVAFSPTTPMNLPGRYRDKFPAQFYIDFGEEKNLAQIALYDLHGRGDLILSIGKPGQWQPVLTEDGVGFKTWKPHEFLHTTRYLRITKAQPDGVFGELLVWEQTAQQHQAMLDRAAMLEKANQEKQKRLMVDAGELFGKLPLIQEIIAGQESQDTQVEFSQSTPTASSVTTIYDQSVRVMPHGDKPAFFAYRMGRFKLLEPGKAYLLTVDFPEDAPRNFAIANRGGEFSHGIYTGQALGDVIFTYTNNNVESINVPLSGKMRTFQQLFYLSDRTGDVQLLRAKKPRLNEAEDGFWVVFSVSDKKNAPMSAGAAIGRIRLFEVPDPERFDQVLNLPPDDLPRRHVFSREEMGDLVINSSSVQERGFDDPVDFYRYKARLQKFLGMNTMAKDLLEFGAPQGWDTENNDWYYSHKFPALWEGIIDVATRESLDLLPYYEYAGSRGRMGLGLELRAQPLSGNKDYTHVTWAEKSRADLTDPATLEDFKKVLELTIVRHKDKGHFLGAWIRPRISQLPVSFADGTRQRFAEETGRQVVPARSELKADESLRQSYYQWWFEKRREFLVAIRDYLRTNGINDAAVIYTPHLKEPGPSLWEPGWSTYRALVTDQPEKWQSLLQGEDYEKIKILDYDTIAGEGWQGQMAQRWGKTWGTWEWNHAGPPADPQRYAEVDGVFMSYPFNRLYTVDEGSGIAEYAEGAKGSHHKGLVAMRHYPLNENTRDDMTGYFVADYERAGPYSMLEEAMAVANGDVQWLGFLSGYNFNSGFPQYTRRFFANFLALPALPSQRIANVTNHAKVVVRQIDTERHGIWFAVINTGLEPINNMKLKLPIRGTLTDAVTGEAIPPSGSGEVMISLEPAELRSFHAKR